MSNTPGEADFIFFLFSSCSWVIDLLIPPLYFHEFDLFLGFVEGVFLRMYGLMHSFFLCFLPYGDKVFFPCLHDKFFFPGTSPSSFS